MDVFSYYLKNSFNFDFVSKFPGINITKLPKIEKCTVQVSLKVSNELSHSIIDSFFFLEWLTGQRPFLKKVGFLYKNFKPLIHVLLIVTLRKSYLNNLFYYILISLSLLKKKSISAKFSFDDKNNLFFITIHDLNFFFNIPEYLYKFSEPISICFKMSDFDLKPSVYFFSAFSEVKPFIK